MEMICNFKRIEKKYLLSEKQYEALFRRTGFHLKPDEYGRSTVMSLYLDTPDHRIIRNSIEAINYKEKLRLRSYGTATPESTVFLELKKKFGGVVYKRRSAMTLTQACSYLQQKEKPFDTQIMSEIDWAMRLYRWPEPVILIACEREAWYDDDHPDLRLTFDRNIRYRENDKEHRHADQKLCRQPLKEHTDVAHLIEPHPVSNKIRSKEKKHDHRHDKQDDHAFLSFRLLSYV